jgi:hypothetical protein
MINFKNTSLFSLEIPFITWGDYGHELHHGMAGRDEQSELLKLERTGPFVPPISFPELPGIVVTDSFRATLETSKLTGFTFLPVIKHHIVDLDWSEWKSDEPDLYPESGEPEDYILEAPHSPEIGEQMLELWELMVEETAHVQRIEDPTVEYGVILTLLKETWNGDDFFRAPEVGYTFVSEKAKLWLENYAKNLVEFKEW